MITKSIASVNNEINHFVSKAGLPDEVIEVISRSIIAGQNGTVKGLKLGDTAPDFTLIDVNGTAFNLYSKLEEDPVVVSFFRGSWCPFCSLELQSLQKNLNDIQKMGASLVAILPQKLEASRQLIDKYYLKFPLLSDENQQCLEAFQVKYNLTQGIINIYRDSFGIDLTRLNANGTWNLPVPATFIIDVDRKVKARHFSHDYMIRMEPRDILEALGNLPNTTEEIEYMRTI